MRTCLLCEKPADSLEHYIPLWLSEVTGQGKAPIMIGTAAAGVIQEQANRGCARAAKHRNLCTACNNALGHALECRVSKLLGPLVAPNTVADWSAYLNEWLERERFLVGWWTVVRALQLNEQFKSPRISAGVRDEWLVGIRQVRDGDIPPCPKDLFVEVARATGRDWGFSLTRQLFDRTRGTTVEHERGFLWAMQANHCLLVATAAIDAQLLKDQGWGYGIVPHDPHRCPQYENMRAMLERSHIDTRLPMIYRGVAAPGPQARQA